MRGSSLPALALAAVAGAVGMLAYVTWHPAVAGRATKAQAVVNEPLPQPWRFPNGRLAIWFAAPEPWTEGHWSACYRIQGDPPP